MKKLFTLLLLCIAVSANAQRVGSISGTVTSSPDGAPLGGVIVSIQGTNNYATTDADGAYTIAAERGQVLHFQLLGYTAVDATVAAAATIDIAMEQDATLVDDVIVVGYGVQKKSVVTAAISSVKADDLMLQTPTRMENMLQGQAAGVNIIRSSGQPGDGSTVRIRGIGTTGNSNPLYVIDGMQVGGGIDQINPADIESMEVLKDAASAAIYGAKGANGVIIVTTKKGRAGDARVTYDVQFGWQNPWKLRPVLNSFEYQTMMNEMALNAGMPMKYVDANGNPNPQVYDYNTDWQKELYNFDAPMQNHQISVSGGTDRANYYVSMGYFKQEGMVGGNYGKSNYDRFTLRANNTYKLMDKSASRDFLAKANLGMQATYAHTNNQGIGLNDFFGSNMSHVLTIPSIEPVYHPNPDEFLKEVAALTPAPPLMDNEGRPFNPIEAGYTGEMSNPIANMYTPTQKNWADKFVATFWADLELYKNLVFRTSYGVDMAFWGNHSWSRPFYRDYEDWPSAVPVVDADGNPTGDPTEYDLASGASMNFNRGFDWQLENTLTYTNTFADKHNVSVLLGQSARGNKNAWNLSGSRPTLPTFNEDMAWINYATGRLSETASGGPVNPYRLASYFGRISYNFDERYMVEFTMRRDGSSRFGPNNKWGTFPSVSVGWNVTNERFAENFPEWINSLKLRGSWGQNGNDAIGDFKYTVLMNTGNQSHYYFGPGSTYFLGTKPSGIPNPDLKWEATEQTDIGIDAQLFDSLNFSVDWFQKKTKGMLATMSNVPSYVGDSKPTGNIGSMFNTGVEFELDYRWVRGDWSVGARFNATYLKNRVEDLGTKEGTAGGPSGNQSLGMVARSENGKPYNYFYGMKTDGIFQNWDEINAHVNANGALLQPNAVPGDVRFVDYEGDGDIDENDRTMIGNYFPKWTYNFGADVAWKGIDLSMFWQGVADADIFDATRRLDAREINLPAYVLDRWTGPGTSNSMPRMTWTDSNENWRPSDLYVQNGAYLRLKTLQIGYTIPERFTKKAFVSRLRVYFMAENLLTITSYRGSDPEINEGIDRGTYPQPRTLSVGVNLAF